MAKYKYNKYTPAYGAWGGEVQATEVSYFGGSEVYGYSSEPTWNGSQYSGTGWAPYGMGSSVWGLSNGLTRASKYYNAATSQYEGSSRIYNTYSYTRTRSQYAGALVQADIVAEDGTYPANGYNATDGYWYIRTGLAFPVISANIGGVWKSGTEGWVNIDGVWKVISDMWVNVDGVWRKS